MIHLFDVAEDLKVVGHTSREVSSKLWNNTFRSVLEQIIQYSKKQTL